MVCWIKVLTDEGLQPAAYNAESLADAAQYEPHEGVYTITNTYETFKVLKLDAHLDRMEDSARRAGIALKLDRARLRAALRTMIAEANVGDVRFRVTAPAADAGRLILTVEPFKPIASELIERGVRCVTVPGSARHNPAAKTTDWMHDRTQIEAGLPVGIYTGLLVGEDGSILEGLSSNFYAILDGELRTAGAGVLPGIAQQIVYEIAPDVLPVCKQAVHLSDIPRLSEAFITSSSRGIVPVVEIDAVTLGDGTPGQVTRELRRRYQAWVSAHLEML